MIHTLDLHFKKPETIASYLIETGDGPALVETGPDSTYPNLIKKLAEFGYGPDDIRHVFLTHIHLDHAGAAWQFAKLGASVYVHEKGARHLADPSRLLESARRIYGDQMDELWGQLEPIEKQRIRVVEHEEEIRIGNIGFKAFYTPGHAQHHIAWQTDAGIFTGDVGGVRIREKAVVPPCPPPDINLEDWYSSIDLIRALHPVALFLTHFGQISDVERHLNELSLRLDDYARFIREELTAGKKDEDLITSFEYYQNENLRKDGLSLEELQLYEIADPAWMSVTGLTRYWRKYHPELLQEA